MKNSAFRSQLQRFLTLTHLLPRQAGRPSSKVMKISDLPLFPQTGQTLAAEKALKLPDPEEQGHRICGRIIQQKEIQERVFYGVRLQQPHVFGPSVMLVTAEGSVVCEVSKEWGVFLKNPEASWIQRRFFLPKPKRLLGRTFLLASTGAETFNHWMMESLPRLALAEKAGIRIREIDHWLVSRKSPSFVREALEKIGVPWDRVVDFSENQHWVCDSLDLVSLASDWGMPSGLAVEFLRKAFPTDSHRSSRRFYLPRGETKDRRVREEAALISTLSRGGFQALDCGALGVCRTAAELSQAEWIVAPHGAALTNMVFAPPGCRVVEIFNPSFTNPCYRMLAARCGHRYMAFYGEALHLTANRPAESSGNIALNPKTLVQSLDSAAKTWA